MAQVTSLTNDELRKLDIINRLIRKQINGTQAAELLHLSVRQVQRLKARVAKDGPKAITHGNRGQDSHNKISTEERQLIADLVKEHYSDFDPTFATEKLTERNIVHDPKTIRSLRAFGHRDVSRGAQSPTAPGGYGALTMVN